MANINPPVGANRRFLVLCKGEPYAGFDTQAQAQAYVGMHKEKLVVKEPAYAAKCEWAIRDRGTQTQDG